MKKAEKKLSERDWRTLLEQPFGQPKLSLELLETANFGQRLGALLLDAWLVALLTAFFWVFLGSSWWVPVLLWLALPLFCWPLFAATPGQWLVGIVVLQEKTLAKISFQQAALRLLAGLLTLASGGVLRLFAHWDSKGCDVEARLSNSRVFVDSLWLAKRREST
jgi:uncharacterized RDD family membrane protein YckC